jgi:hypothetical protein
METKEKNKTEKDYIPFIAIAGVTILAVIALTAIVLYPNLDAGISITFLTFSVLGISVILSDRKVKH